jgi:hypothetical protein
MIASALKGKLLVFAVFFIGITSGILIMNFYETRVAGRDATGLRERDGIGQREANRVHDFLGLNREQRVQIDAVLEEGRAEVRKLRAESRPKIEAIEENTQSKIRAILNPEQLQRYEEYSRTVRERRSRNRRNN